jgi:hypothetical protein
LKQENSKNETDQIPIESLIGEMMALMLSSIIRKRENFGCPGASLVTIFSFDKDFHCTLTQKKKTIKIFACAGTLPGSIV